LPADQEIRVSFPSFFLFSLSLRGLPQGLSYPGHFFLVGKIFGLPFSQFLTDTLASLFFYMATPAFGLFFLSVQKNDQGLFFPTAPWRWFPGEGDELPHLRTSASLSCPFLSLSPPKKSFQRKGRFFFWFWWEREKAGFFFLFLFIWDKDLPAPWRHSRVPSPLSTISVPHCGKSMYIGCPFCFSDFL